MEILSPRSGFPGTETHCFFCLVFLLLCPLALISCGGSSSDGFALNTGEFSIVAPTAELEAQYGRFFTVDAVVNGVVGSFIVDTGADAFVVSPAFAELLDLPISGTAEISTIIGTSRTEVRRIEHFSLGNIEGEDIDAAVIALEGFDGIIGKPLFEHVLVVIDYASERLTLMDPSQYRLLADPEDEAASWVSLENFVLQEISVNGEPAGPVRLDTGSAGGLHLARSRLGDAMASVGETLETTFAASNGNLPGTAFVGDLKFAGFELADQFVVVQDQPLEVGLLGNLTLQQFTLFLDLSRAEAIFRRERIFRYALAGGEGRRRSVSSCRGCVFQYVELIGGSLGK